MEKIKEDKKILAKRLEEYINIIKNEYKDNIMQQDLMFLNGIKNYEDIIIIKDTGTISLFVSNDKIYLPKDAYKIMKAMSLIPGYGSNPNHVTHNKDNMISNNNTFIDFIKHNFIKGNTALDYFEEIFFHEVMHLCGGNGSTALSEGINELKSREIAQKYNLNLSCCAYPKEVEVASKLQDIWGKEFIDKLEFIPLPFIPDFINKEKSSEDARLYSEISDMMNKKFQEYNNKSYPGITGPIRKTKEYNKIDYSDVLKKIDNFKNNDNKTKY